MKTVIRCVFNTSTEKYHLERKVWWGWSKNRVVKFKKALWTSVDDCSSVVSCWLLYDRLLNAENKVVDVKEFE